jgi:1-acyl-sn-glycerol-3-phosphate acyltransferase
MENPQNPPIVSWVSPWLTPLIYALARWLVIPFYFSKIEISGQEHIPRTGGVILAPTHRSRWDGIIVPLVTGLRVSGRHPRAMVTSTEAVGIQGWFIRRLGGFPVDVEHLSLDSLEYGKGILARGEMLMVFPEGGIFRDINVHPLKRGVSKMALEVLNTNPDLELKILPISIKYPEPFPQRGCQITIKMGESLNVADYQNASIRKGSQQLTQALEKSLKELHDEPVKELNSFVVDN